MSSQYTSPSKASPSVTIVGNQVPQGTKALDTVPYADVLHLLIGKTPIEAYSRDTKTLVAPEAGGSAHGFIAAAQAAYAGHYPLVLSPDSIWLLITQGFALHVRTNADALRHRFVAHSNKVELQVDRPDFVRGFGGNDWEGVFAEFSANIRSHIGEQIHDAIVPTFSTTGIVEKAAFEITLMDAMQSYFLYRVRIVCGIPHFVQEGTPEDWRRLRAYAASLLEYDLHWWGPNLLMVLDEFVAASEGRTEPTFWVNFYKEEVPGCGDPVINGHILKLFPYLPAFDKSKISDRLEDDYAWREAMQLELANLHDLDEYMWHFRRLEQIPASAFECHSEMASENWGLFPEEFPSGLSCAPFKLQTNHHPYTMEFIAGFVGVSQDQKTLALRPEIGWAVRECLDA